MLRLSPYVILAVALTAITPIAIAAPLLNGLSVHQELGREQFIGAVFSDPLTRDAETLASSPGAKRMELKILAEGGITTRRFSRQWIEGMAINNNNTVLTAQADNMVKFTGLFRGHLQPNDHVVFQLIPDEGVNVEVNGTLLGTINDPAFFPLLLRTWVGRVPLSSAYRDNILQGGNINADLRFRYDRIQPSEERINAIAAWRRPPAAEPQDEPAAAVAAAPVERPRPTITPPPIAVPIPVPAPTPRLEPTPTPQPEPEPVPEPDLEEDDEPVLTAESLLARQFYHSDLLRAVNRNITYPRRAEQRRMEGGLRIGVVIDRRGNIVSMEWLEETPHDLLNREAWSAITRTAPFVAIPDNIPGEQYEFSVPVNFRLP